ncbi:EamA family transporter [Mucilaginibacter sp. UR6-1]|uniref:EamA family transporter n=1 Tax=Mucilaginibacter sp. UR6-1 TaxID=1435643 RepID=UPI001E346077|nr:EamA family transporter [Mucilaginibacter sp. UR6-1]MCC8407555.1 EamA family transporter [Mucilaginibacter sp. UR6-1]
MSTSENKASTVMVIVSFALVYIVWGSTYFFIQMALQGMPPFFLGAARFLAAGSIMLIWCIITGEKVWNFKYNKHAMISGVLLLFGGTGALILGELEVPSAVSAILVSAAPIWFVLLDAGHWRENLKSPSTIIGLLIGFGGVVMLFGEQLSGAMHTNGASKLPYMAILVFGSVIWSAGSLYSKYKAGSTSTTVNTTWQMLAAGIAFIPCSIAHHEWNGLKISEIPAASWWAVAYLVIFGSIVAFSAYVWLLKVRPATQVSTYAYVNPVIAVLLGILFANEQITPLQISGLVIILSSVLLINLAKYRSARKPAQVTTEQKCANA